MRQSATGRIVSKHVRPSLEPEYSEWPEHLNAEVKEALQESGIEQLYSHQVEAFEALKDGSVTICTDTASGKSLCFNLPIANQMATDQSTRALYLYPTKALAQDQVRSLASLKLKGLRPAIYDGDTPQEQRRSLRKEASVVLTNPDMLHAGILPNHQLWSQLLSRLEYVVVDEAHVYRGVFGSHVANVLRRLRRLASLYGSAPKFILASATIYNPLELAENLTGVKNFKLIDRSSAGHSLREECIWNPPLVDEESGKRYSPLHESIELITDLVRRELKTICFIKSRRGVELITHAVQERLKVKSPELVERIAPYRGGYTPMQRRELERKLSDGELSAVVATDALELGIDIGTLDAAICVTFPGTVASLKQMWGRAGRKDDGLAVYIAGEDALDQFFCRHPDSFLERPVESAILNYAGEEIYRQHVICSAFESPLSESDSKLLGEELTSALDSLQQAGKLRKRGDTYVLTQPESYPAAEMSLRSASTSVVNIVDRNSGEVIGSVEEARACDTLHPGAIYIHLGQRYEVQSLNLDSGQAVVREHNGEWFTQPKKLTDTTVLETANTVQTLGVSLSYGKVRVSQQVLAYKRKQLSDHSVIDMRQIVMPESSFETQALWYTVSSELLPSDCELEELLGTLHAVEHSQIAVLPLLAMCDRWDIGGLSTNHHPQTGTHTIFIYEAYSGGVGITRDGSERFRELTENALKVVSECQCESGCPSCIQSPKCGNLNEPLSKGGAVCLMEKMLSH